MTNDTFTITDEQRTVMLQQIGRMNVAAISGGRVRRLPDGIELPVGCGYSVRVRLTPVDEYTVERMFVRNGHEFSHGVREHVYCDEIGETAYRASCFRNDEQEYWPEAIAARAAR